MFDALVVGINKYMGIVGKIYNHHHHTKAYSFSEESLKKDSMDCIIRQIMGSLNELWHDKTNKVIVRPAKTQISLSIRPVWSESSLCT